MPKRISRAIPGTASGAPPSLPMVLPPERVRAWQETYEATPYRDLPWFSRRPNPWLEESVRQGWLRRGSRVLDVGCGAGTNVLWLARQGFSASGIDIAPGAIRAAEARARAARLAVDLRVADALALPYPEGWFHAATDTGSFHTLPPHQRPLFAAEMARVVRPGGVYLSSCAAREETREMGPPYRLSVEEVMHVFEPLFQLRAGRYRPARRGSLRGYDFALERRRTPQPPPRP